eukprot:3148993-Heterocapsa_arctica.AAC.1
MAVKNKMQELCGLDLRDAVDLKQWYLDCYSGQMTYTSSLKACMKPTPATRASRTLQGGGGRPRAGSEVPGLGELLGAPMPMTDKVVTWSQECIGQSFLVDGKMCGADIAKTRPAAKGDSVFMVLTLSLIHISEPTRR